MGGKGGPVDSVRLWDSVRSADFEADTLLECAVKDSGAKTVKYCFPCACSFRAKGLVGSGGSCTGLGGAFEENGNRAERMDEIGAFVGGDDCLWEAFSDDNKEL